MSASAYPVHAGQVDVACADLPATQEFLCARAGFRVEQVMPADVLEAHAQHALLRVLDAETPARLVVDAAAAQAVAITRLAAAATGHFGPFALRSRAQALPSTKWRWVVLSWRV